MLRNIVNKRITFPDKQKYNFEYSDEFVDIVSKLVTKDPKKRFGSKSDAAEILAHPWFTKSFDVNDIFTKVHPPTYIPELKNEEDLSAFKAKTGADDLAETMIPQNKLDKSGSTMLDCLN